MHIPNAIAAAVLAMSLAGAGSAQGSPGRGPQGRCGSRHRVPGRGEKSRRRDDRPDPARRHDPDPRRRPGRHPRGSPRRCAGKGDPLRSPGRGSRHPGRACRGRHGRRDGTALAEGRRGKACRSTGGSGSATPTSARRRDGSISSGRPRSGCPTCREGRRRRDQGLRCEAKAIRSSTPSSTADRTKVRCRITYHMILSLSTCCAFTKIRNR